MLKGRRGISEKLNQLRKSALFKNSALVGMAQIAVIAVGFITNALLARMLGPEKFGQYQLILAWFAVGGVLGLTGFGVVILKAGLKGYENFFWIALRFSIISSVLGAAAVGSVAWILFSYGYTTKDSFIFIGLIALAIPTTGFQHYESAFIGKRDYRTSRLLAILISVANMLITATVAYVTDHPQWVFISYLVTRLTISLYAIFLLKKGCIINSIDKPFEKDLIYQGIRQSALNIFSIITSRLDKIVLGALDPVTLSYYYVGTIIPSQIMANSKTILGVVAAEWGAAMSNKNLKYIKVHGKKLMLLGVVTCTAIALFLPLVLPLAFGQNYAPAIEIGQWFSLVTIGSFWFQMVVAYDQFQSNGKYSQNLQILRQILFVILLYVSVDDFGVMGVVFSQVVTYFMAYGVTYIRFRKINNGFNEIK